MESLEASESGRDTSHAAAAVARRSRGRCLQLRERVVFVCCVRHRVPTRPATFACVGLASTAVSLESVLLRRGASKVAAR